MTVRKKIRKILDYADQQGLILKVLNYVKIHNEHQFNLFRSKFDPTEYENVEQKPPTLLSFNPELTFQRDITLPDPVSEETQSKPVLLNQMPNQSDKLRFSSSSNVIETLMEGANSADEVGNHEASAKLYAIAAELFKQERNFARAQKFARKSAQHFLKVNKKDEAVQQYLYAADVWINNTAYAITMANSDLEEAEKLSSNLDNLSLHARVLLQQAQYKIFRGSSFDVSKRWQEVENLLTEITPTTQAKLSTELAIQKALVSKLDGNDKEIGKYLEEANSRDWPPGTDSIHLELLRCLLFYYSESGSWQDVDRIYNSVQRLLEKQDESQRANWLMLYASSLVRRGNTADAKKTYLKALDFFNSEKATGYQKLHFLQEMNISLIKHTQHESLSFVMQHESEKVDLALNNLQEDLGHLHRENVRTSYFEGNTELAFIHARNALVHSWRKGDWSGLDETNKIIAFLHYEEKEYIPAVFAAISGGDRKQIERYASSLNDLYDIESVSKKYVIV